MGTAHVSIQPDVRALLDRWSDAIRVKDIDRLMSLYADDAVYFDLVPPLQIVGSSGIRKNFLRWFDGWIGSIGQEIHDLHMLEGEDIVAVCALIRASGTLKDGREVDYYVRASLGCKRSSEGWAIAHEHVSLPVDFKTGRAVMDLAP